jgi:hypothetical protein
MRNVSTIVSGLGMVLGLGLLAAAVGCEPVDDGAATRNVGWNKVLTDNVLPGDRPVYNTIEEDPMDVSMDPCTKTTNDAHAILKANCAQCHGPMGAVGLPPWNYVLDDDQMKKNTWIRQDQPAIPFLKPGDPANSAIFLRAALLRNMPPVQGDLNQPFYPRVSYSEASVLQDWITNCMM